MGMATMMKTMTGTLGGLMMAGMSTELDYLTTDEQATARALEAELIADAQAGVDIRIRLIADVCSR